MMKRCAYAAYPMTQIFSTSPYETRQKQVYHLTLVERALLRYEAGSGITGQLLGQ